MRHQKLTGLALAGSAVLAGSTAVAADKAEVDKAFETLKTYDWGADRKLMAPIDQAVVDAQGDAAGRKDLETRLLAVLAGGPSRSAKDYICRTLKTMGTAASVPAMAAMLADKDVSHMGRYALERIPAPQAAAALRDALGKLSGALKVGVIGSLGVRGDTASVGALSGLLGDGDKSVASAAAHALGVIGDPRAGKALAGFAKKAPEGVKPSVADACLICAEQLLADGKKAEAIALYKALGGEDQPKHVRVAATRGLLAAAGTKD